MSKPRTRKAAKNSRRFPPQGRKGSLERANVSTLKAHFGVYLDHVRAGKNVIVFDREQPVAELIPFREKPLALTSIAPALTPSHVDHLFEEIPPLPVGTKIDSLAVLLEDRRKR